MTDIVERYTCECNNKTYINRQSFSQHKRTKGHIQWENSKELKDLKTELTRKDNKIVELEYANKNLQELNYYLVKKMSSESGS